MVIDRRIHLRERERERERERARERTFICMERERGKGIPICCENIGSYRIGLWFWDGKSV